MDDDDSTVTLDQAKTLVRDFCAARGWDAAHNPKDLAIGLVTEAAELLEIFRFESPERVRALMNDPADRVRIADELADSLYCILRFAQLNDFDLSASLRAKLIKNEARYPANPHQ